MKPGVNLHHQYDRFTSQLRSLADLVPLDRTAPIPRMLLQLISRLRSLPCDSLLCHSLDQLRLIYVVVEDMVLTIFITRLVFSLLM